MGAGKDMQRNYTGTLNLCHHSNLTEFPFSPPHENRID